MFSTIDSRSERHFVIYAETPGLLRELAVPEPLEELAERVRAWPREERLATLARAVLDFESERGVSPQRIRLQLWRTSYAPGGLDPVLRMTREVRAETSEP